MKLKKQKNTKNTSQKEKLRKIFTDSIPIDIEKSSINPEQYKVTKKQDAIIEKSSPANYSSIRPQLNQTKQLFSVVPNNISNTSNILNFYKNNSNYSTPKFINTIDKNNIISLTKNQNNKNIDLKTTFLPSFNLNEKIQKTFYGSKNTNKLKVIKNNFLTNTLKTQNINTVLKPNLPALQQGGVVKEPTVAYLHKNEAVVPLKGSDQFSEFINTIQNETAKTISKNEFIKNLTEMRNSVSSSNTSYTQKTNQNNTNNKSEAPVINAPTILSPPQESNITDTGSGAIGGVYGGSSSRNSFFMNTYKIPEWRMKLG